MPNRNVPADAKARLPGAGCPHHTTRSPRASSLWSTCRSLRGMESAMPECLGDVQLFVLLQATAPHAIITDRGTRYYGRQAAQVTAIPGRQRITEVES